MTASCRQGWCAGLTATASLIALVVTIYSVQTVNAADRLTKLEGRNDDVVRQSTDINYIKAEVTYIRQRLDSMNTPAAK